MMIAYNFKTSVIPREKMAGVIFDEGTFFGRALLVFPSLNFLVSNHPKNCAHPDFGLRCNRTNACDLVIRMAQ